MTTLASHRRGDTFSRTFTLSNGWTGATFTGGVKFTVRESIPASSVVTDDGALAQVSVAGGGIVFAAEVGTVTIAASVTTTWPAKRVYWDIQGVVDGSPDQVYTIDSGDISILPDITRSA